MQPNNEHNSARRSKAKAHKDADQALRGLEVVVVSGEGSTKAAEELVRRVGQCGGWARVAVGVEVEAGVDAANLPVPDVVVGLLDKTFSSTSAHILRKYSRGRVVLLCAEGLDYDDVLEAHSLSALPSPLLHPRLCGGTVLWSLAFPSLVDECEHVHRNPTDKRSWGEADLALEGAVGGDAPQPDALFHRLDSALVRLTGASTASVVANSHELQDAQKLEDTTWCVEEYEESSVTEHDSAVQLFVVDTFSQRMLAVHNHNHIRVWDLMEQQHVCRFVAPHVVRCIAFCHFGMRIITAGGSECVLWDALSGDAVCALRGHEEPITSLTFNPALDVFACAAMNGVVSTCLLSHVLLQRRPRPTPVHNTRMLQDKGLAADQAAAVATLPTTQLSVVPIHSIAVLPPLNRSQPPLLAAGDDEGVIHFLALNKEAMQPRQDSRQSLNVHLGAISCVAASPTRPRLVSVFGSELKVWNTQPVYGGGRPLCLHVLDFSEVSLAVTSVSISDCGSIFATGSPTHVIPMWSLESGRCLRVLRSDARSSKGGAMVCPVVDSSAHRIITASTCHVDALTFPSTPAALSAQLPVVTAHRLFGECAIKAESAHMELRSMLWRALQHDRQSSAKKRPKPSRDQLTACYNKTKGLVQDLGKQATRCLQLQRWRKRELQVAVGGVRATFKAPGVSSLPVTSNMVQHLRIDATAHILVTAEPSGAVRLWDVDAERCVGVLVSTVPIACISATGGNHEWVVCAGCEDKRIVVWDVTTFVHTHTLAGHNDSITALLALHHNAQKIVLSGTSGGRVGVWKLRPGSKFTFSVLRDDSSQITALAQLGSDVFASGDDGGRVCGYSLAMLTRLWFVECGTAVTSLLFDHQRRDVLVGGLRRLISFPLDMAGSLQSMQLSHPIANAQEIDVPVACGVVVGYHLVFVGTDATLRIWDLVTNKCVFAKEHVVGGWLPSVEGWRTPEGVVVAVGSESTPVCVLTFRAPHPCEEMGVWARSGVGFAARLRALYPLIDAVGSASTTTAWASGFRYLPFESPPRTYTLHAFASVLLGRPVVVEQTLGQHRELGKEVGSLFGDGSPLHSFVHQWIVNECGDLVIAPEMQFLRAWEDKRVFLPQGTASELWKGRRVSHGDLTQLLGQCSYTSRGRCRQGGELRPSERPGSQWVFNNRSSFSGRRTDNEVLNLDHLRAVGALLGFLGFPMVVVYPIPQGSELVREVLGNRHELRNHEHSSAHKHTVRLVDYARYFTTGEISQVHGHEGPASKRLSASSLLSGLFGAREEAEVASAEEGSDNREGASGEGEGRGEGKGTPPKVESSKCCACGLRLQCGVCAECHRGHCTECMLAVVSRGGNVCVACFEGNVFEPSSGP